MRAGFELFKNFKQDAKDFAGRPPSLKGFADQYTFIAPDLRGFADSDKPYDGYEPKTIAEDMLGLLVAERVEKFHILSHDLGGPPSVALAYMASGRALSLATIEMPFYRAYGVLPRYVEHLSRC